MFTFITQNIQKNIYRVKKKKNPIPPSTVNMDLFITIIVSMSGLSVVNLALQPIILIQ